MASTLLELEGTWEEILAHSDQLAGYCVRLTVLSPPAEAEKPPLDPKNQRMLAVLKELEENSLTEEERVILDDMERYIREHPFSFSSRIMSGTTRALASRSRTGHR